MSRLLVLVIAFTVFHIVDATQPLGSTKIQLNTQSFSIGNETFQTSCNPTAHAIFQTATAYLYSFWFPKAAEMYQQAINHDKHCCIAYWGLAQTELHPIWDFPTERLSSGWKNMAKAVTCVEEFQANNVPLYREISQRETDYINALAAFFEPNQNKENAQLLIEYAEEMEQIAQHYGETDENANILYGLSLLAVGYYVDDSKQEYVHEKKAALKEELVSVVNPNSPGMLHFIIHAFDQPGLAEFALWAADRYGVIAPDVPHALHMPSHIYVDVGRWASAIQANQASMNIAYRDAHNTSNHDWIHASDFLSYSYLQLALDEHALALVTSYPSLTLDMSDHPSYDDTARVACHYLIETRQWELAADFELEGWIPSGGAFQWSDAPYASIYAAFVQMIGRIETYQFDAAAVSYQSMLRANDSLGWPDWETNNLPYWKDSFTGLLKSGEAWMLWIEDPERGINAMQQVVHYQNTTFQPEIGHLLSGNEQLARMYELQQDYENALVNYQQALDKRPNRYWLLYGAARCAEKMNNYHIAFEYFHDLLLLVDSGYVPPAIDGVVQPSNTNTARPETLHAHEFISSYLSSY